MCYRLKLNNNIIFPVSVDMDASAGFTRCKKLTAHGGQITTVVVDTYAGNLAHDIALLIGDTHGYIDESLLTINQYPVAANLHLFGTGCRHG